MANDIDLSNSSLEFPDVECGGDIEAGPNIVCIACHTKCAECRNTCVECQNTCVRNICG